ncbi:MAG: tyrosine protein phosphatase [Geothermobacteraceae bacterium]
MIDLHCHILPGVDDGADSLEVALEMARLAAKDGVSTLVATPHVPDCGLNREQIAARTAEFQQELVRRNMELTLLPGADAASSLGVEGLTSCRLGTGPGVLVEFPHTHLPAEAGELVFELICRDLQPIITHPERNAGIARNPELVEPLVDAGAWLQLTAGSLMGTFGPEARSCARFLLRKGWVHVLASDAHGVDWRPPGLSAALKVAARILGRGAALKLVYDNPLRALGLA